MAHFGYREVQKDTEASQILGEASQQCDTSRWPYPVIQYLLGQTKMVDLFAKAINNDDRTEAHGYVGLDLALLGKAQEASEHFRWVKEYGNRMFVEYRFAIAELERLKKEPEPSK